MRLGVDMGGTKTEVAVFDAAGRERLRRRLPTPHGGYEAALEALAKLILDAERGAGDPCTVGIGMPGAISPKSGLVINAYNTPYNGRSLKHDLEARLGRATRFANDADCFALSEACDGAARGAATVFGAILGTGVGGGIVFGGALTQGPNAVRGEWGHNPLPWMTAEEYPGPECYCGRRGCIEQFLSGGALARDEAAHGREAARERYAERLARALAHVVNLLDPDAIVLGGGVSNLARLYTEVPALLPRYVYADAVSTPIVPPAHGDASGVRGAAWLWPA